MSQEWSVTIGRRLKGAVRPKRGEASYLLRISSRTTSPGFDLLLRQNCSITEAVLRWQKLSGLAQMAFVLMVKGMIIKEESQPIN
jgi:hypothetical protein